MPEHANHSSRMPNSNRLSALDFEEFKKAIEGDGVQFLSIKDLIRRLVPYLSKTNKTLVLTVHVGESTEYIAVLKAELIKEHGDTAKLNLIVDQVEQDKLQRGNLDLSEIEGKKLSIFSSSVRFSRAFRGTRVKKEEGALTLKEFARLFGIHDTRLINFAAFSGYDDEQEQKEAYLDEKDAQKSKTKKKNKKRRKPKRRKRTLAEMKAKKLKNELDALTELKEMADELGKTLKELHTGSGLKYEYLLTEEGEQSLKQFTLFTFSFANQKLSDEGISSLASYIAKEYAELATLLLDMAQLPDAHPKIIKLANSIRKRLAAGAPKYISRLWASIGSWTDDREIESYMKILPTHFLIPALDNLKAGDTVIDLGAGQTVISENSFLAVLKKTAPFPLCLYAVDPAYKEQVPFPAALQANRAIKNKKEEIERKGIKLVPAFAHELEEYFKPDSVALLVSAWALDKLSLDLDASKILKNSIMSIVKILKPGGVAIIAPLTQRYVKRIQGIIEREAGDVNVSIEELQLNSDYTNEQHRFAIQLHKLANKRV